VVKKVLVVDDGRSLRLELHARDVPDLDVWAAEQNADLFRQEFGRGLHPVATEVV